MRKYGLWFQLGFSCDVMEVIASYRGTKKNNYANFLIRKEEPLLDSAHDL